MPVLVFATFLIGAALGMRFKVLVLVPALGLLLCGTLAVASTGASNFSTCFIAVALAAASLQIGYLCGAAMRFYLRSNAPAKDLWSQTRSNVLPT